MNSIYEKEAFVSAGIENEIIFILPGLDISDMQISGGIRVPEERSFGVGVVADDIPRIDLPTLFRAFSTVTKINNDIVFGIFSNPMQLQMWNIPDMLDVYGLKDKCSIAQPDNDLRFGFPLKGDMYSTIDLLILPHQEDIINIPAIEAAYCGLPTLLSPGGATEEHVFNKAKFLEKSDLFVSPPANSRLRVYDSDEITEHIISLYNTNKKKREYDTSYERYSWDAVMVDWVSVLKE